jgi:hypothetical protein
MKIQRENPHKGEFMSKKIAFFLIMVLLVNMTAWGESSDDGEIGPVVAIFAVIGLVVIMILALSGEADAPDDNIRLTSMQNENDQKNGFGSLLNVMQHINIGYTPQNNKSFFGLRLQF